MLLPSLTTPEPIDIALAVLVIALQWPDVASTNAILSRGGRELNPFVRRLMRLGSLWWLPKTLIAAFGAIILMLMADSSSRIALVLLNGMYILVVLSNYRQLKRLKRLEKAHAPSGTANNDNVTTSSGMDNEDELP